MPTPPAKRSDIDSRPAEKQLADCAHIECETNAHKTGEKEADGCLLQLPEPDPEPDPERDPEAKIRGKGYNIEEIRDYVRRLTEHPDRNRHINTCVCISFDNKWHLVCDFDDLYDHLPDSGHISRCVCTSFDNKRHLVCDFHNLYDHLPYSGPKL